MLVGSAFFEHLLSYLLLRLADVGPTLVLRKLP
jgi:hypothetical protein